MTQNTKPLGRSNLPIGNQTWIAVVKSRLMPQKETLCTTARNSNRPPCNFSLVSDANSGPTSAGNSRLMVKQIQDALYRALSPILDKRTARITASQVKRGSRLDDCTPSMPQLRTQSTLDQAYNLLLSNCLRA